MWLGFVLLSICRLLGLTNGQLLPHSQSPCGKDYGGCDKSNGLCWGTSETTHYCTCRAGFRQKMNSKAHVCTDVDECSEGMCSAENSICENTLGSYRCHCRCGHMLDYTGEHCLLVEDIQGLCEIPYKCVLFSDKGNDDLITDELSLKLVSSDAAGESCGCENGFRQNACGYCEDIDECIEGSHDCKGAGSACKNIEGHYYCDCEIGYVLCGKRCYGDNEAMPTSCADVDDIKWLNNNGPEELQRNDIWCEFLRDFDFTDSRLRSECRRSDEDTIRLDEVDGWEEWTCWSACKPTCWGGLQTRTRKCAKGVVGIDCKGRGSESKECYSGMKCPFRVRKDVNALTREEIDDLLQAMEKFKNDNSAAGFHNAASSHGWPKQCNEQECCPHGARLKFLAWHRSTMLNIEKGLARHLRSKSLGLPYWNWLAEDQTPPNLAWSKELSGRPNPFANMTVRTDLEGPMRTVQRDSTIDLATMRRMRDQWVGVTTSLMKPNTMAEFTESLESVHNSPHAAICRNGQRCRISMGSIFYAAFDPIFVFHHTQVDRLWAVFQKKLEDEGSTAWTLDTAIETGEKRTDFGRSQMPFGNDSINPYPILKAVNNMRDSYYYKELTGVIYDTLDNDGMPQGETERRAKFHPLLIAHYVESFHAEDPVYVNYYEVTRFRSCASLRDDSRIGGGVLLSTHRRFRNTIPNLLPAKLRTEPTKDSNIELKACYTYKPDCTSRCPSVREAILKRMTTPLLMFRRKESHSELYKFNWSPGNVMPWWPINFQSHYHFIYFYGSRASHIYQVTTIQEWKNCDISKASPFFCKATSPCKFSVGVYYILDSNHQLCKKGLRLIVSASRE